MSDLTQSKLKKMLHYNSSTGVFTWLVRAAKNVMAGDVAGSEVNRVTNLRNKKQYTTNTSGVTGVCWHKNKGKWMAQISVKSRFIYLGYFDSFKDAKFARKAAEIKYGFHKNHGAIA